MKKVSILALVLWMVCLIPASAQTVKKPMTVDDLAAWQRITGQLITNDGQWVACCMEPWVGDATVRLYDTKGEEVATFPRAGRFRFSASSRHLLVEQQPGKALTDSLKLRKTKKDKRPMNALLIYSVNGKQELIDSLKQIKMAEEADWIAYMQGRKDSTLHVRPLEGGQTAYAMPHVKDFGFAKKSGRLYFVTAGDSAEVKAGLYLLDTEAGGQPVLIKAGEGEFRQVTFDEKGQRLAFLYCAHRDSCYRDMSLWLSDKGAEARQMVARGHRDLPEGWVISEHGKLQFAKTAPRLFFGTAPEPKQKDTLTLAENRPNVQVWSWDEPVQYTVQHYNKEKDLKKSYLAVCLTDCGTICQLADIDLPDIRLGDEGDAPYALLSGSRAYSLSSMWEGRTRSDYYAVEVETGERRLLSQADYGRYSLSPKGKYAYGYVVTDSCWQTFAMADGQRVRLTSPDTFIAWDEQDDHPDYPYPYGAAGWTEDDEALLLYDRYDIWSFSPDGKDKPLCLTADGRKSRIVYRRVKLDPEERFIDTDQPQLLRGFNEVTKGSGYYRADLSSAAKPRQLMAGDYSLRTIVKAKDTDDVVYTMESYEQYPDLLRSTLSFGKTVRLTHEDEQQHPFIWGTAELVSWTSLDGRQLEGVVYKPADFDPSRKYPMIVNFYERNSDDLYEYHMPEPHRSTVDYRLYNSQGYIIFNPDVRYTDGYPGESCYNCVMPGISMMLAKGYIDPEAIGAQGHSWGGYQVAYLATRTPLFAAIESGAPVVNMYSAYGGIRWGSGMARSFQYEHTQSRLGGTPWNAPKRYYDNSPLFSMDKVTTPILIMHNDADGHVPWYQGIEYFVAMKRLGKPCWLLNYTGEPHWPMSQPNRADFQRRMLQFFNHYLKHEPMPKWMKEGVPAVEQPFELGY